MRSIGLAVLGVVAGLTAVSTAGQAALINGRYTFSASNFVTGAPPTPVVGTVAITFDNTLSYAATSANVSLVSLTAGGSAITLGSALQFSYSPGPSDTLVLGGSASGVGNTSTSSTDFALFIQNATSASPSVTAFSYSLLGNASSPFVAATTTTSFTATAVPEPISMALLGTAVVGMVGYRRLNKSAV